MARAWLINSRGIAKKVRNATLYSNHQIKDLEAEAKRECPNCKYVIDNSDVSLNWSGLPAGVKFDPTDIELLEHLSGKVGAGKSKAHIFIDEFIPTLDGDQGLCYTHPENLPCIKKDGSSVHFFHRTSNAYATGCKKRRKIRNQYSESEERVRWHKTGKTKPVMENGVRKGWKKIMVLYKSLGKGCKPDKANWVMHQYHLGANEEENDGELVVSKVFCQKHTKQAGGGETEATPNELDGSNIRSPKTPKTVATKPPSTKMSSMGEADEHNPVLSQFQEEHPEEESEPSPLSIAFHTDEAISSSWWARESKAIQQPDPWKIDDPLLCPEKIDDPLLCPEKIEDSLLCPEKIDDSLLCPEKIDDSLLCHEVLYPFTSIAESSPQLHYSDTVESNKEQFQRFSNTFDGFPTLDDINTDTHSDFHISDLQFGSQDSIMSSLDRI